MNNQSFDYIYDAIKDIIDLYKQQDNYYKSKEVFTKAHYYISHIDGNSINELLDILCDQKIYENPIMTTFSGFFRKPS